MKFSFVGLPVLGGFGNGTPVVEMLKRRQFLPYLTMMREENE